MASKPLLKSEHENQGKQKCLVSTLACEPWLTVDKVHISKAITMGEIVSMKDKVTNQQNKVKTSAILSHLFWAYTVKMNKETQHHLPRKTEA